MNAWARWAWATLVVVSAGCNSHQGAEVVYLDEEIVFLTEIRGWTALGLGLDGFATLTLCADSDCQVLRVKATNGELQCVAVTKGVWSCAPYVHSAERVSIYGPALPSETVWTLGIAIETVDGEKAALFRTVEQSADEADRLTFYVHKDASGLWIE